MRPLVLLCSVGAVVVLDYSIVFVAVPSITVDLGVPTALVPWLANAYALAFGSLLLLGGRLGDHFGRRRMLSWGLVLFTASSVVLAIAPNTDAFLAGRVAQGIGAALLAPAALALLTVVYPDGRERTRAIGAYGAIAGAAAAVGTLLGGVLTEVASWHWAFLINVPLGVAAFAAVPRILPDDRRRDKETRGPLDLTGALTATLGLFSVVFGITQAEEHGVGAPSVLLPLTLGAALIAAFLLIERRTPFPLLRLSIFRLRGVSIGNGTYLIAGAGTFGALFLLSIYFQEVRGFDALEAGLAIAPLAAGTVLASALATWSMRHLDPRWALSGGLVALTAGLLLLSRLSVDGAFVTTILPGELFAAVGLGFVVVPITKLATDDVPPEDAGLASGLFSTAQELGGAFGLALLTTVASSRARTAVEGGADAASAQVEGIQLAFAVAAVLTIIALCLASVALSRGSVRADPLADGPRL